MIDSELDARHPGPQTAPQAADDQQHPDNDSAAADDGNNRRGDDGAGEQPVAREIGGRDGPDPTRYGDWEKNGRCIDF